MTQASRWRISHEHGVTLVEIMVSIVILGVSLTAFAGTISKALATITQDEQFVRGNQLAADLLEEGRALTWDCTGLDDGAAGWVDTATGGQTMASMDHACAAGRSNLPTDVIRLDDQDYAVSREVVWIDDPAIPGPQNHKRIIVDLAWTVRGRDYAVSAASDRAPTSTEVPVGGSVGPAACTPGEITAFSVTPGTVNVTPAGVTNEGIAVLVQTCDPASSVTLDPTPASARVMTVVPDSGGRQWTTTFPAGTTQFVPSTRTWTATSTSASGTGSVATDVQFVQSGSAPLEVLSLALSPSPIICVKKSNQDTKKNPFNPIPMTVTIRGATPSDVVTVEWTDVNQPPLTMTSTSPDAQGNARWTHTIPTTARFTTVATTISVRIERISDGVTAVGTFSHSIVEKAGANHCP